MSDFIVSKSIIYNFLIPAEDKEKVKHTLDLILKDDNIGTFLNQGTTKFVYEYKTGFVFKIVICRLSDVQRFTSEPMIMLQSSYTNKPFNIVLYAPKNKIQNECPFINVYDTAFKNSAIFTWIEERAEFDGLRNFPITLREQGEKFIKETSPILEAKGFTDLGVQNIGFFSGFPHIRWIDVQPEEGTIVECN